MCWTIGGKEEEMAQTSTVECDPVALAAELQDQRVSGWRCFYQAGFEGGKGW
jgi:hypothetical protein